MIALGILVVLIAGAVFELTRLGGGHERRQSDADSASVSSAAPTTTTIPPPTTRPQISYQVQRGESLTVIARRFGVSIDAIVAANDLADKDRVAEGQLLVVPPSPPVALVITPAATSTGHSVQLKLAGAQPSENVRFVVKSPTGSFTGPPHTAPQDGTVTTTYSVAVDAPAGTYAVTATGDRGTTVRASFNVTPAVPAT